jgi:hypothetical protein
MGNMLKDFFSSLEDEKESTGYVFYLIVVPPKLGGIFKRLVDRVRYGKLDNADRKLIASNKTLEAALRTYNLGLGANAVSSAVGNLG